MVRNPFTQDSKKFDTNGRKILYMFTFPQNGDIVCPEGVIPNCSLQTFEINCIERYRKMKTLSYFMVVASAALFMFMPLDAESAVAVTAVTITDTAGAGCNKTKTSSFATVPVSRIAHSIAIDWTHHITVAGVIGGVHSGSKTGMLTNALTHSDSYSNNPGTDIIVYAEADFSMMYCGGGELIEWVGKKKQDNEAC